MSPRLTAKPAAIIVGSLGIGTQALSSVIRMKTPSTPMLSTTSTAKLTSGSVIEATGRIESCMMPSARPGAALAKAESSASHA